MGRSGLGPSFYPYSPECVEEEFCEVCLEGLSTKALGGSWPTGVFDGLAFPASGLIARTQQVLKRLSLEGFVGNSWEDAELGEPLGPHAWRPWTYKWEAKEPGEYELCVRATDAAGNTQPLDGEEVWNVGGYGVNVVQRVPAIVVS
jgi:hypothetical protein